MYFVAKKILIPLFNYRTPDTHQDVSAVRITYLKKLNEFNLVPILVSGKMNTSIREELYDMCSGVLIPGGHDLDPKLYGEKPHPKTQIPDTFRDNLELEILKKTFLDKKPFLGICRGAHILAIGSGGKLIQHLPDITDEKHGLSEDEITEGTYETPYHEVKIAPKTKMFEIIKKSKITVSSRHHQAIGDPGKLVVAGRSPGGIIEMVERSDLPFHIGVQSHPELDHTLDALFAAFSYAVNKYNE